MSISDEAVEAAAKGLAVHRWPTAIGVWDSFGQGTKDDFRDQARAALEAAAPHIIREAKAEAREEGYAEGWDCEGNGANPYRSQD